MQSLERDFKSSLTQLTRVCRAVCFTASGLRLQSLCLPELSERPLKQTKDLCPKIQKTYCPVWCYKVKNIAGREDIWSVEANYENLKKIYNKIYCQRLGDMSWITWLHLLFKNVGAAPVRLINAFFGSGRLQQFRCDDMKACKIISLPFKVKIDCICQMPRFLATCLI